MKLTRGKTLLLFFLTLFIILFFTLSYFDYSIQKMIQEKRFLAPTRYYSSPTQFFVGQVRNTQSFRAYFDKENYRQRDFGSPLQTGDYSIGHSEQCQGVGQEDVQSFACLLFRSRLLSELNVVHINEWDQITQVFRGEQLLPSLYAQAEAPIFAQYLGNKPTQQTWTPLGDIPRYCLDAIVSIEDPQFLEHRGFSLRGFARAMMTNLRDLRFSQGGSTITQQLVRNYFLTLEKKISRKIKEIIMSLVFEFRVSKDDILESYLNVIYLGQSGVFEVRGYGSAAHHYFQKQVSDLNLSECALLAAIVNNPGRYNPVRHPDKAKSRRERVLNKMIEHDRLTEEEKQEALLEPLPTKLAKNLSASAPYYIDAVNKELLKLGIEDRSGLNVFTAMEPLAQSFAEKAVSQSIEAFEKDYPAIVKIKKEKNIPLQALLVASNPLTGEVVALVGGRNFRSSPFNRAVESQRQVGSVFKPLVYLTALQSKTESGLNYTPLTPLNNSPYRLEYEDQVWEPKNYSGEFSAPVPLFFALKESMNVPTARLAMEVGLDEIIATARSLGVESDLKPYPSLSLGAFELRPLEVLKVYNSLSQGGVQRDLQIVKKVTDARGDSLFTHPESYESVGDPRDYAVLVGMMKETLTSGTGAFARKMGFHHRAAGKTGTTSDTRDAWFAGFTPFHTAVTWVGYDDGTPHHLTGASGALPIWTRYMKNIAEIYSDKDFDIPEGVKKRTLTVPELKERGVFEDKLRPTELLFREEFNE